MNNFLKIYSKIIIFIFLLIFIFFLINIFTLFFEFLDEKRIVEGIFLLIIAVPLFTILIIGSIYILTNSGYIFIKNNQIVHYGKYFRKSVIKKSEIDKIIISWENKSLGIYGSIHIIKLHIYTLGSPQLKLKIDYRIRRNSIARSLIKLGYNVKGDIR